MTQGRDLPAYCHGLIDTGFARIPKIEIQADQRSSYQGSIKEHNRLLKISREVIERLIESPLIRNAAFPTLLHPDLHKRNICVSDDDPTIVTGLIDWQSTSVEPAFVYANETPDFATLLHHNTLVNDNQGLPAVRKEEDYDQKEKDAIICSQTFDVYMTGLVPKLRAARTLDETLLRPFRYCYTSWRDSAAAVRQVLIEVSQNWKRLGLHGSCPYLPSEEELAKHRKQYEDFVAVQKLKLWLMRVLDIDSDGWVPAEAWEWSKKTHRDAFDEWMQTSSVVEEEMEGRSDDGMSEEKAKRLWPFDER